MDLQLDPEALKILLYIVFKKMLVPWKKYFYKNKKSNRSVSVKISLRCFLGGREGEKGGREQVIWGKDHTDNESGLYLKTQLAMGDTCSSSSSAHQQWGKQRLGYRSCPHYSHDRMSCPPKYIRLSLLVL